MSRRHFTWMSCGVALACLGVMQSGRAQSRAGPRPAASDAVEHCRLSECTLRGRHGPSSDRTRLPAPTDVHAFRWTEAGGAG